MQNKFEKVEQLISKANSIAIICHISPDGDTLGSGLALYNALTACGKAVYVFCDDLPNHRLSQLDSVDKINEKRCDNYDLAFSVDCSDYQRMGNSAYEFDRAKTKIAIDHHKTNDSFADINIIDSKASATAEIMFAFIEQLNKSIPCMSDSVAKLLYTGIVTDSGCFSFSSVSSKTMSIASKLLKYNIDADKICYHFTKHIEKNVFDLKVRVLAKTKFYLDNKVGIVTFRQEDFDMTDTNSEATEGIINNVQNIGCIEISVAITEVADKQFKVSFRTKDNVDASRCAMVFGGGGHKNAAGCRLNGYYEDILDKILKVCSDSL